MTDEVKVRLAPPDAFDKLERKVHRAMPVARVEFRKLGVTGEALLRAVAPVGVTKEYRDKITHSLQGDTLTIFSSARHAVQVEEGRRPGRMPPPAAIARRLGIPLDQAFLVARAIGRRGTKGLHPVAKAAQGLGSVTDRAAAAISNDLKREMESGW